MFEEEISQVNGCLKNQLWMDFEMCRMRDGRVILAGYLDEWDQEDKIRIAFKQVWMIEGRFLFTYDGDGQDFISIVDGEDARKINQQYRVPAGNTIFNLHYDEFSKDMIIIAQEMGVEIIGQD